MFLFEHSKRGQGLSVRTIIMIGLGLVVLVALFYVVGSKVGLFSANVGGYGTTCKAAGTSRVCCPQGSVGEVSMGSLKSWSDCAEYESCCNYIPATISTSGFRVVDAETSDFYMGVDIA